MEQMEDEDDDDDADMWSMERILLSHPLFLGSEKRCIHDGSNTGNKQTSERAMHSASWVSMKTGVGLLNGSFVDAFESETEDWVYLYDRYSLYDSLEER